MRGSRSVWLVASFLCACGQSPVANVDAAVRDASIADALIDIAVDAPVTICDPNVQPQPNLGLGESPGAPGCPGGMLVVDTFCIDKVEASLVRIADGTPWSPYFNPGTEAVRAVAIEGAVPQGYISGQQAGAACVASGKRLCTDVEWLRACRGSQGTTYPYGDQRQPSVCNDARAVHPAVEYFDTTDAWIWTMLDHACLNQLADGLETCGARTGCASEDGVFDLMGNLHEWTAAPSGTLRGGFYVDTATNGEGCLYVTTAHSLPYWDYSTGFRCCSDRL